VTLIVDDGRVRAHVTETTEGKLELEVETAPQSLRNPSGTDARLEFVGERGACRLMGTAVMVAELQAVFRHDAAPQLLLRGDRVRAPVEMKIEVEVSPGDVKVGETRDLRANGALIVGPLDLDVGRLVLYALHLPGRDEPIKGQGRVTRIAENGDVAIHFGDMTFTHQAAIALAVFEARVGTRR
jgi:hypothetical protein